MAPLVDKLAAGLDVAGQLPRLVQSPFRQLLAWLRQPEEPRWRAAVFVRALSWALPGVATPVVQATAAWLEQGAPSPVRAALQALGPALCGDVRLGEEPAVIECRWVLPAATLQALSPKAPRDLVAVVRFDPTAAAEQEIRRRAWRRFLALGNLLQFLPLGLALTAAGAAAGRFEQAGWARLKPPDRAEPPRSAAWQDALAEAVTAAAAGLRALMVQDLPAPVVGFELQDSAGAIVADAELAWSGVKLAVLRSDQAESTVVFQAHGWRVIPLAEGWHTTIERYLQEAR